MIASMRESLTTALTLLAFSVVCTALLAGAYVATEPTIARSQQLAKMALLEQMLPAKGFDNDPSTDTLSLPAHSLLGLKRPGKAYIAKQDGVAVAVVLEAIAPDGYSGDIKMLVGILADGRLAGVRVTSHKETPGLGDYIDIAKSDWINRFAGKSLLNPPADAWKVRKDGGQFDTFAGATVTPRAVINAVHNALLYFEQHKAMLMPPRPTPANSTPLAPPLATAAPNGKPAGEHP